MQNMSELEILLHQQNSIIAEYDTKVNSLREKLDSISLLLVEKDEFIFELRDTIVSLQEENRELQNDSKRYHSLMAAGVDSWEFYEEAMEFWDVVG